MPAQSLSLFPLLNFICGRSLLASGQHWDVLLRGLSFAGSWSFSPGHSSPVLYLALVLAQAPGFLLWFPPAASWGLQQGLQWPLRWPNPARTGIIQPREPLRAEIRPLSGSLCLYLGVFKCVCEQGISVMSVCKIICRVVFFFFCLAVKERVCRKFTPD